MQQNSTNDFQSGRRCGKIRYSSDFGNQEDIDAK